MKAYIEKKAFGERVVLSRLSLEIEEGKTTLIMAPSGWGKTTLLRILSSLDTEYQGRVENEGKKNIVLFQEDRLVENISALSNLLALGVDRDKCISILSSLGLGEDGNKKVSELSGGMKRRVAIARILLLQGDRYFLDEPFRGLDDVNREKTAIIIRDRLKGKTIIVVSHRKDDGILLSSDSTIVLGE